MRRIIIMVVLLLGSGAALAQTGDTIWVSTNHTVTLIFGEAVSLVDVGSGQYLAQTQDKVVLLKAAQPQATVTSLFIRSGSDQYFMGYVGYAEQVPAHYHDYRPVAVDTVTQVVIPALAAGSLDTAQVAEVLDALIDSSEISINPGKYVSGIGVYVHLIKNGPACTYLKFRLFNKTTLPYLVESLSVQYRQAPKKKRLADVVEPISLVVAQIPKVIPAQGSVEGGLAFPHVGMVKQGRLELLLSEAGGGRHVTVKISSRTILYAEPLKEDNETNIQN